MKNNLNFFSNQFKQINYLLNSIDLKKIKQIVDFILKVKKNKSKVIIAGNGGSASTASHFSTDLSVNGKIKTISFNEYNLITALSNDFGYENWVKKTLEFHADPKDLIIFISSSGESKNMINACKFSLKKKYFPIVTLTGFKKNNSLNKLGHVNFWVNSKKYNHVENIHQFLLLSLTDATK